jgi:hypothetical protein
MLFNKQYCSPSNSSLIYGQSLDELYWLVVWPCSTTESRLWHDAVPLALVIWHLLDWVVSLKTWLYFSHHIHTKLLRGDKLKKQIRESENINIMKMKLWNLYTKCSYSNIYFKAPAFFIKGWFNFNNIILYQKSNEKKKNFYSRLCMKWKYKKSCYAISAVKYRGYSMSKAAVTGTLSHRNLHLSGCYSPVFLCRTT